MPKPVIEPPREGGRESARRVAVLVGSREVLVDPRQLTVDDVIEEVKRAVHD